MNVPLVSFNGGEIGKEAMARVDMDVYATCAEIMENVFPLLTGGMIKAPGTIVCDETPGSGVAIVRPFIYNVDDTLTLEFSDNALRVDLDGGTIQIEGALATVGSPADNGSGGSSSAVDGGNYVTLTAALGESAKVRWAITTSETAKPATFLIVTTRRPLKVQVGTTTSNANIMASRTLYPGEHLITVTPGAGTYYIQAELDEPGVAIIFDPTRQAPGDLTVPTPWADTELASLRYRQSNNVYWLYHPDHKTRVLERYSNYDWSLRLFRPLNGPFEPVNTTTTTLTPGSVLGSVTITASAAAFAATDVGRLIELTHTGQTETRSITGNGQTTDTIRVVGADANRAFSVAITGTFTGNVLLERSIGNETDWATYQTYTGAGTSNENDGLDDQIIYYRINSSGWVSGTAGVTISYSLGETTGRAEIVYFGSATSVGVEVFDGDFFGAASATTLWALGSWNDADGWPAAGTLNDGRHQLAANDRYWSSEPDDFESFLLSSDDDGAINRRMATGRSNTTRWMETADRVMIGTSGETLEVRSSALGEAITPTNINLRGGKNKGVANAQPIVVDDRIVFIARAMARLYQTYPEGDKYKLDDLTALHKWIGGRGDNAGFIEIAYQEEPDPRVYAVRADGEMAVLTFRPDEQVYGWARYTEPTGGGFESVCVIPGVPEDTVMVIVSRVIDGVTKRFREKFAPQNFVETRDAVRVQSAVIYEGASTSTITGLSHLEGEEVAIWANGRVHESQEVTSGQVTLDYAVTKAVVGLNYAGKWKSAKLAYGARRGTALGQDKKIGDVGLVLLETPIGMVGYGRDFENVDYKIGEYTDEMVMDSPVEAISDEATQPSDGATLTDARLCILMDKPGPATILAIVPDVDVVE
ncbi:MAG: hypothetical protein E6Q97_27615 [Desulfurellales bacterium]|nr:MAG: hypothetical protein E6Q97_27615 [Desulfurellales bacterium]